MVEARGAQLRVAPGQHGGPIVPVFPTVAGHDAKL